MKKNLAFRELRKSDYSTIEEMIIHTWEYDKRCKKRQTAKFMAKCYLYDCLAQHTFSKVAVYHNSVIGVILGRSNKAYQKKNVFQYKIQSRWLKFLLALSKDGCFGGEIFSKIEKVDQNLLSKCNQNFGGELVFFVVDDTQRGLGIGKIFLHYLKEYMQKQRIYSFYLFTDTACNYQFYESQGFQKMGEKQFDPIKNDNKNARFFIYQYDFSHSILRSSNGVGH